MKVLIACEYSGRVRDAFARKGHTAVSVDILPSDTEGWHYRGDVLKFLKKYPKWDLMIAFPPCTHISNVGASDWYRKQANGLQDEAIHFFLDLWEQKHISRIAIENPAGRMSTVWRKPDQYIQPWWFGDPWIKRTGLWLKELPLLVPTRTVKPKGHWVDGGNYSKFGISGANEGAYALHGRASNESRSHFRAMTFKGVARAMARQWG